MMYLPDSTIEERRALARILSGPALVVAVRESVAMDRVDDLRLLKDAGRFAFSLDRIGPDSEAPSVYHQSVPPLLEALARVVVTCDPRHRCWDSMAPGRFVEGGIAPCAASQPLRDFIREVFTEHAAGWANYMTRVFPTMNDDQKEMVEEWRIGTAGLIAAVGAALDEPELVALGCEVHPQALAEHMQPGAFPLANDDNELAHCKPLSWAIANHSLRALEAAPAEAFEASFGWRYDGEGDVVTLNVFDIIEHEADNPPSPELFMLVMRKLHNDRFVPGTDQDSAEFDCGPVRTEVMDAFYERLWGKICGGGLDWGHLFKPLVDEMPGVFAWRRMEAELAAMRHGIPQLLDLLLDEGNPLNAGAHWQSFGGIVSSGEPGEDGGMHPMHPLVQVLAATNEYGNEQVDADQTFLRLAKHLNDRGLLAAQMNLRAPERAFATGGTLLHALAYRGFKASLAYLIEQGADCAPLDDSGRTLLEIAQASPYAATTVATVVRTALARRAALSALEDAYAPSSPTP